MAYWDAVNLDEAFFLRCSHYMCYPSRPFDCDCQADSSMDGRKLAYNAQVKKNPSF